MVSELNSIGSYASLCTLEFHAPTLFFKNVFLSCSDPFCQCQPMSCKCTGNHKKVLHLPTGLNFHSGRRRWRSRHQRDQREPHVARRQRELRGVRARPAGEAEHVGEAARHDGRQGHGHVPEEKEGTHCLILKIAFKRILRRQPLVELGGSLVVKGVLPPVCNSNST